MRITVIGLGKIGLPIAVSYAKKGNSVIGLDTNLKQVDLINSGIEPFPGEYNLDVLLKEVIDSRNLQATSNSVTAISSAEIIVVCIPLLLDNEGKVDFKNIDMVMKNIGSGIAAGTLVSIETTLPVGTTKNRFSKILEEHSKMTVGKDIYLVFSPERVLTGRVFKDLRRYPKIVGGVTQLCTEKGVQFYEKVLEFDVREDLQKPNGVWAVSNSETAEFTKIAEATYRDVNIGLANEFELFAGRNGIDFSEVREAANSQPYSNIHVPGISVGGHCIPVYSNFYINNNTGSDIAKAARKQNLVMPSIAINIIKNYYPNLKRFNIGIIGISYRPEVKESTFSGALELLKLLKLEESVVYGFDSLYSKTEIIELGFEYAAKLSGMDGLIVNTAHRDYAEIDYNKIIGLKFIFDGRNMLKNGNNPKKNFKYLTY